MLTLKVFLLNRAQYDPIVSRVKSQYANKAERMMVLFQYRR